MAYKYLLFDLDGTLTDPAEGITGGVMYALEKFGIKETKREKLFSFIGPPLMESFDRYYNFTEEQGKEAAGYYREYYAKQGKFENLLYEGIPELLDHLKKQEKKLIVATSKGESFAREILDHFDLTKYFDFIAGQNVDGLLIKKSQIISRIMREFGIEEPENAIMIGDREHDIIAAKEVGIASAGVLYGYGSREELEAAGAGTIVATIPELEKFLLS